MLSFLLWINDLARLMTPDASFEEGMLPSSTSGKKRSLLLWLHKFAFVIAYGSLPPDRCVLSTVIVLRSQKGIQKKIQCQSSGKIRNPPVGSMALQASSISDSSAEKQRNISCQRGHRFCCVALCLCPSSFSRLIANMETCGHNQHAGTSELCPVDLDHFRTLLRLS